MRRPMRTRLTRRKLFRIKAVIVLILMSLLLFWLDRQLRPVITTMAQYQCRVVSLLAINEAVTQELSDYPDIAGDLVQVEKNAAGMVTSVEVNSLELNRLKARLTEAVTNRLLSVGKQKISIPLGTLTGWQLLAGRGPEVQLQVVPASYVDTTTYDKLETAGINQTQHAIFIKFSVQMSAILPGYTTSVTVENSVCIAQTMIVGSVPQVYAIAE